MMRVTMYETWSQAGEERGPRQEGRWRRRWSTEPPERSLGQVPGLGGVPIILIACICIQGRGFQPTRRKLFQYSVIETCDPQINILLLTMVTMFQWSPDNARMLVDAAVWQHDWIILTLTLKCCDDTRWHMTATQYISMCVTYLQMVQWCCQPLHTSRQNQVQRCEPLWTCLHHFTLQKA